MVGVGAELLGGVSWVEDKGVPSVREGLLVVQGRVKTKAHSGKTTTAVKSF